MPICVSGKITLMTFNEYKKMSFSRSKVVGLEAFCIFLKKYGYPIRYGDMIALFGRSVSELCMISTTSWTTLVTISADHE